MLPTTWSFEKIVGNFATFKPYHVPHPLDFIQHKFQINVGASTVVDDGISEDFTTSLKHESEVLDDISNGNMFMLVVSNAVMGGLLLIAVCTGLVFLFLYIRRNKVEGQYKLREYVWKPQNREDPNILVNENFASLIPSTSGPTKMSAVQTTKLAGVKKCYEQV